MTPESPGRRCYLIVKAGGWLCGLPLEEVEETLRPLPLQGVGGGPAFLRGVSVVRGRPTPVVSLGLLLGGGEAGPARRLVSLRLAERRLALEVEQVLGLRWLGEEVLGAVPGVVQAGAGPHLAALGAMDGQLLAVLGGARVLPEELWARLEAQGEAAT